MYFKKLELIGFKSFPERTELNFEPGITAIVGPNGCGKTNLSDAIRWVLGEQSAKSLRGQKMEDIIFNGTEVHKPLSLAEVSLTLNNEDKIIPIEYSEVTVTRCCYRSGESEYFINKNPCRLKDIHELFMDTGIGTESYSVMEQGKVDLILSSRPEDRRFVLEEAAGIAKYKSRREAALRKMELTNQNLLRIDDIIAEVKREIISLKRQVTKAERYKEDYERLKKLEVNLGLREYKAVKLRLESLGQEISRLKDEEVRLNTELTTEETKEEKLHLQVVDIEKSLVQARDRYLAASEEMHKLENRIIALEERISQLKGRVERAAEEIKGLQEKTAEIKKRIEAEAEEERKIIEDMKEAEVRLIEKEKAMASLLSELEVKEKDLERGKNKLFEKVREITALTNEVEKININLTAANKRLDKLGREKEKWTREAEDLASGVNELKEKVSRKKGSIAQASERTKELESAIQGLRLNSIEHKRQLEESSHKKSRLSSRLNLLEEWDNAHRGYGYSLMAVLKEMQRRTGRSFCGLIPELIKIETSLAFSARKEEIKRLGEELPEVSAIMFALEKRIAEEASQLERLEAEREELLGLSRKEEISIEAERSSWELKEEGLKRLREEGQDVILEWQDLEKEKNRLEALLIEKKEVINYLEKEKLSLEEEVNKKTDNFQAFKVELEEARGEKIKATLAFTSPKERKEGITLHLKTLNENLAEYIRRQERLEAEIAALQLENGGLKDTIESQRQERERWRREKASFKEEMDRFEEERKKAAAIFQEEEGRLRQERGLVTKKLEELHRLEISRTAEESQVRNIKERILSLYQVDLDTAAGEEIINEEESRAEVENLRGKLQAIGPVNLMALEENKELEDRFSLLKREREDIIRAREELHQVITRINQTSRQMFTETLEKIREEFHRMFRLLFNGGKADLILQEGDALESGVEIVARPPGKNLSTISQLSGGEKALTAIALLFALFKIRPSPFCVLDEIDAPLDESNIERFSSLLKEFLKTTQFIIITHNKKTIALGQVIYGITMEEPGISKIVSVKFSSSHAPTPSPVTVS